MSDTDSPLSDAPSDLEDQMQLKKNKKGILKFFTPATKKPTKAASPPPPKRSMTPPHEPVLADNDDIAFIVMFRSRFNGAFPKIFPNFGPQDIERGVVDSAPSSQVEDLLCALLGLLLNRKQDVKRGHYNRALEEAIQTHKSQWPKDWDTKNPLLGNTTFMTMSPTQRLTLLRTLILWSLSSSEIVKGIITASYKQTRHEDDLNQPLSVQPWGSDGHKRRYFLIEGLNDTHFRVYRESNPAKINRTWFNVAGSIDELKALANKLATDDGTKNAKILSNKMLAAVPRFEETEEKCRKREYRQAQKERFKRPAEPQYSLYEGRTRGKRMKYTFSDEEEEIYSDQTTRRSTRNTRNHTPVEPSGPTITQSGRQVKNPQKGFYGESIIVGAHAPAATFSGGLDGVVEDQDDDEDVVSRRPRRAAATTQNGKGSRSGNHIHGYNSVDELDDEDEASEQDYGDDEEDEHVPVESDVDESVSDEDEEMEDASEDEAANEQMIVKLRVKTPTPEKKTNGIKLKLNFSSPSKQVTGAQENTKELPSPTAVNTSTFTTNGHVASSESPTQQVEVEQASAVKAHNSPLPSPKSYMAPEKTNGFTPKAIGVGNDGT